MHRSGTSITARIIMELGFNLGSDDDFQTVSVQGPENHENPTGFNELLEFSFINRELLHESNQWPGDVYPHIWDRLKNRAKQLVENLAVDGFKDPRTSLLLPFWSQVFEDAVVVKTYRPAAEIAASLVRRGDCDLQTAYSIADAYEDQFWSGAHSCGIPVHVVSYASLIDDAARETNYIAEFLGVEAPYGASKGVDPKLRHHHLPFLPAWWKTINLTPALAKKLRAAE
jgi:hypothetical protein